MRDLTTEEREYLLKIFEHMKGPQGLWDAEEHAMFEWFCYGYLIDKI
jgi:hypothetical protein